MRSSHDVITFSQATIWGICGDSVCDVKVAVGGSTANAVSAVASTWLNATIWMATIPPTAASFTPVDITASDSAGRTITLANVLFGDVWVCSGQSNMEYAIAGVNDSAVALAEMTNYSNSIRLFHVGHAKQQSPQPEVREMHMRVQTDRLSACPLNTGSAMPSCGWGHCRVNVVKLWFFSAAVGEYCRPFVLMGAQRR